MTPSNSIPHIAMLRSILLGSCVLTLAASNAASAQETPLSPAAPVGAAQADAAPETDIVITGSRIRNATLTSPSPLQVVTAETIQNTGATNIQDVLSLIPAVGIPSQTRVANAGDTNPGLSTINLRNLGTDRTLVLIDGRRTVAGIPGTAQVDIGMIPPQFIERVDVLTGGASAVYGSDAIAGVVNFVYKKNFEGLQANAQAGISELGDDKRYNINATFGQNFADGRGNFMIFGGYNHEGNVPNTKRERTASQFASLGNLQRVGGNSDLNLTAAQNLFQRFASPSNVGPGGIFNFGGVGSRLILPDGSLDTFPAITRTTVNDPATIAKVERFGYNPAPVGQQASPSDQFTAAMRAHYDVTDNLNLFAETTFSTFKTVGRREASPMRTDSALGAFTGTNGFYPIQFAVRDPATGQSVILNNPLVPTSVFNAADNRANNDAINSKDVSFLLRTTGFGDGTRSTPTERDNFRGVLGGELKLGGDWTADAYYQYGFTKQTQGMTGLADLNRLAQSLQAIPDVFDFNNNGNRTEAICVDANARAQGCVPVNVYGLNADGTSKISPAAAAYLQTELSRQSKQVLQSAALNVGGTLFQLPAGPVQVVLGAEWRNESSSDDFDPLTNTARNGYVQLLDTSGSFNVKEAYGEVVVPILRDTPFFQNLTLRGAARVSDYSTVGTFSAWNIGGDWAPVEDIRFRAVYASAVRAPNIGELFAASAAGIITINDPCQGVTLTATSALAQNCRANPGVLANIQQNGSFTLTSSDTAGVGSITAANPDIRQETGKTLTLGMVLNPRSIDALRNFTFSVDYFDIRLEDAINRLQAATVLNKCYLNGLPEFCQFIERRQQPSGAFSAGSVEQVTRGLINSGGSFARGLDFTFSYNTSLFDGTGSIGGSWTHLLKQGQIQLAGDAYDNTMGEIGTPRDSGNLTIGWENRNFGFTFINEYVGKQMFDFENYQTGFRLADGSLPDQKLFTIASKIYSSLQVRYKGIEHFELYAGVNNLFDVDQPPLWVGTPNGSPNAVWDIIGRRYYAGVRAKF
ncbi:TonB-dependent receptor plug domain-containing protein [Polymorphobacter fuscus]|uniref:TonB-dependent receptor n=1 Tax=Sandarakinorhabdus fusca TaxID=1439888 RepID=A0A7C9GQ95_9SPHN|nr:TonB-dependent receptor [Polymorphobacter fuscus]KAB7646261.1 TonB-dependent receptor [Polymorphobacter fuscus]MQT17476.1 TonB-dependent receptor [Polymorphobacter fuscus]NJC09985.1 outer membrane receptor protein involved in Fe transport [Polymorphobacter fuscus]